MKKLFIKIVRFFKEYKQFGFVIISIVIAGALSLLGKQSAAHLVLAVSAFANVIPLVWGMVQDLRMGTYGVDILAVTAIVSAVLFKEYWAGIIIVFMLSGGAALEDYAERRAQSELTALLARAPQKAHVIRGRKELDIPVSEVVVGDRILIKPGEVVPVDAIILEGISDFDESSLTGESLPVNKTIGQDLLSGSINIDGAITAKALNTSEDSQFSQIIKLVKSAQASKSPFVRMADRYAVPFTLLSFTIALGAWALSGDSLRFLQVLVVATPCPLILGAPIAMISGMSRAAKHGIIIKNGSALEQLAGAKTFGFDKTGTLTQGTPLVKDIMVYGTFKKEDVLKMAATLEQSSNHVLASAIVSRAKDEGIKLAKAKHIREITGKGLESHIAGVDVLVGRFSLIEEMKVTLPKSFKQSQIATTAAYVAIGGSLAGVITFEDAVRPDAKKTLARLKELGVNHFLMVTGDNKTTAGLIAKHLGIDQVISDALPGDKLRALDNVAQKPVGFVGDGVNDAPVLTSADVGIALGARGSTAASESADVVIMLDNFEQVAIGVDIAKRTIRIATQAIMTGIIMSTVLMFIFATGKFPPIYGAAIQELVDVVVIVYALRAHGPWKKQDILS
ncbi:MAG: heavy metal translocating P-type ATPase [Candidatus Saccharibacteria bacterium]|nr:heavy metal translocating P-type ATPase [Candidatus Saccharibacteria bacterium]